MNYFKITTLAIFLCCTNACVTNVSILEKELDSDPSEFAVLGKIVSPKNVCDYYQKNEDFVCDTLCFRGTGQFSPWLCTDKLTVELIVEKLQNFMTKYKITNISFSYRDPAHDCKDWHGEIIPQLTSMFTDINVRYSLISNLILEGCNWEKLTSATIDIGGDDDVKYISCLLIRMRTLTKLEIHVSSFDLFFSERLLPPIASLEELEISGLFKGYTCEVISRVRFPSLHTLRMNLECLDENAFAPSGFLRSFTENAAAQLSHFDAGMFPKYLYSIKDYLRNVCLLDGLTLAIVRNGSIIPPLEDQNMENREFACRIILAHEIVDSSRAFGLEIPAGWSEDILRKGATLVQNGSKTDYAIGGEITNMIGGAQIQKPGTTTEARYQAWLLKQEEKLLHG